MGTKPLLFRFDHRVDDPLETRKSPLIVKHTLSEKRSIYPPVSRTNAGECCRNRCYRGATWLQQPVNYAVSIEERYSKPLQRHCCCALAHADRAGEAENDHWGGANVTSIALRSSWVTCTGTPNQASNPGRP